MKVVFLGATRGMGRVLARAMARRGDELFVLGRGEADLRATASDLALRGGRAVGYAPCDLARSETFGPAFDAADAALGAFDTVVLTAGVFATHDRLVADASALAQLLDVNFTQTILWCEEARRRLLVRGGGTLVVFSSVAGDRGRKPTFLYGASKAGLSHYLEGLDHRFRESGLTTICVKPGFVKTSATVGLDPPPFAADPEQIVGPVLAAIDRGRPVVYAPRIWGWVMWVIRRLPRFVMRRVGF